MNQLILFDCVHAPYTDSKSTIEVTAFIKIPDTTLRFQYSIGKNLPQVSLRNDNANSEILIKSLRMVR